MNTLDGGVLGLFPSFAGVGGVERAGRIAWEGITRSSAGENHLICYGPPMQADDAAVAGALHHTRSQLMAVLLAASRKWPVRLVLVWHIGMLKLLPFIRTTQSRTTQSKTVLFLHGVEVWRAVSPHTSKLLRRVDLFLTASDFTWERFLEYQPHLRSAPHVTVPMGLGAPMPASLVATPADPPSVLMIGRIARSEAYKGHDAVISSWSKVLNRFPGAKLRMIGPCEMREELSALAVRHGVGRAIEITGVVSEGDKARYLAECRCMALPSRAEGFGLVYLEAMRMGRPCVVSTSDAGREVVCPYDGSDGNPVGGLAVDPGNTDELAATLIRLMTPGEDWNRWSAASRQRYESRYTEVRFHERLLAALAGLA